MAESANKEEVIESFTDKLNALHAKLVDEFALLDRFSFGDPRREQTMAKGDRREAIGEKSAGKHEIFSDEFRGAGVCELVVFVSVHMCKYVVQQYKFLRPISSSGERINDGKIAHGVRVMAKGRVHFHHLSAS